MNKKLFALLPAFLLISLLANVYLYLGKNKFEEAWLNQFISTSEIEQILKSTSADISFDAIKQASISRYGEESVKEVDLGNEYTQYGSDKAGLRVNETLLLFKKGFYHGSKSNLPN